MLCTRGGPLALVAMAELPSGAVLAENFQQVAQQMLKLDNLPVLEQGNHILRTLTQLVNNVESLKTNVEGLKTDLQGVKTDVQTLKADVQGVKTDVQTLKSDVQTLKADVQTLKADVQTLKVDMQGVKTDVESCKTGVQKVKRGMKRLRQNVSSVGEGLTNIAEDMIVRVWNAPASGVRDSELQWLKLPETRLPPENPPKTKDFVMKANKAQITELLRGYGLATSGKRDERRTRLLRHLGVHA